MSYIYGYANDFERSNVVQKINEINDKLAEEEKKPTELRDKKKEIDLKFQQFYTGLKLSTGYFKFF